MPETDPLDVPMDQVITRGGPGDPAASDPKGSAGGTSAEAPKVVGRDAQETSGQETRAQETVDPAEGLPDEPDAQNDLA